MNASWIGRGRGGRLAIYAGSTLILIFIMLLYRAASTEIARLQQANELCTQQKGSLAEQLQIIYDYKIKLEKFLTDEKSSNAVAKKELQQQASREKSLRDKDSIEAMQKINALNQDNKLLHTENQDLMEKIKNYKAKIAEDSKKYNAQLQQLKDKMLKVEDNKKQSMEHLKSKFMNLENEKAILENKYNELMKASGSTDSKNEHLRKENMQLRRELEEAKKKTQDSLLSPLMTVKDKKKIVERKMEEPEQLPQPSPSNQLQVSRSPDEETLLEAAKQKEKTDDSVEDVAFALKDGQIVPADPNFVDAAPLNSLSRLNKLLEDNTDQLKNSNRKKPSLIPNVFYKDKLSSVQSNTSRLS